MQRNMKNAMQTMQIEGKPGMGNGKKNAKCKK